MQPYVRENGNQGNYFKIPGGDEKDYTSTEKSFVGGRGCACLRRGRKERRIFFFS